MQNAEFEKLLVEAIDETLSSLGDSPKKAIFFYLENTFGIKSQEIKDKIEAFDDALKNIFGEGADFLEKIIVKKLCEKTGSTLEETPPEEVGFVVTVAAVKRQMKE
jgi:hypothetical protein